MAARRESAGRLAVDPAAVRESSRRSSATSAAPHGSSGFFAEDRTSRSSLLEAGAVSREPLARMLRPVYRAIAEHRRSTPSTGRSAGDACPSGPGTRSKCSGLPRPPRATTAMLSWSDARLRDALRALREESDSAEGRRYVARRRMVPVASRFPSRTSSTMPRMPSSARPSARSISSASTGRSASSRLRIAELEAEFWPRCRGIAQTSCPPPPLASASMADTELEVRDRAPAPAAEPLSADAAGRSSDRRSSPAPRWPHLDVARALAVPRAARARWPGATSRFATSRRRSASPGRFSSPS